MRPVRPATGWRGRLPARALSAWWRRRARSRAGRPRRSDRRDAEHLVRLLLAGKLHPVRVPGPAEEALRDLVRAREDIRSDLMRARHRLSKLLLRHEVRFDGRAWTERHRAWLGRVELGEDAAQVDYLGAVEALLHRKAELERQIEAAIPTSPWAREVGRVGCPRRGDT